MNDVEIESLLEEAGYRYDPPSGRYLSISGDEGEGFVTEDIAGELDIPVDDLLRWEEEQSEGQASENS